jgi:hypothetical protein
VTGHREQAHLAAALAVGARVCRPPPVTANLSVPDGAPARLAARWRRRKVRHPAWQRGLSLLFGAVLSGVDH